MDACRGLRGLRASRDRVAQSVGLFAPDRPCGLETQNLKEKPRRISLSPWILAALREAEGWGGEPMVGDVFRVAGESSS